MTWLALFGLVAAQVAILFWALRYFMTENASQFPVPRSWAVDRYVCGFFCGSLYFDSEKEAVASAYQRGKLFGIIRCGYVVRPVEPVEVRG